MMKSEARTIPMLLQGVVGLSFLTLLPARAATGAAVAGSSGNGPVSNLAFTISWPLRTAPVENDNRSLPLLQGTMCARLSESKVGEHLLQVTVLIDRPSDERRRLSWNSTLAYPQYNWMSAVRVWDKEHRWLWPNLLYLLRPFGIQGIDRYGGWDPGKHVDNDFAAVLVRKYDYAGKEESTVTLTNPLVSAEWHAEGVPDLAFNEIVHKVSSDTFLISLCGKQGTASGQVRIWLIYADFLHSPVPAGWPKEPEFNGGILKFFTITWTNQPGVGCSFEMHEAVPPEGTRFDWKKWINRPAEASEVEATPRLSG